MSLTIVTRHNGTLQWVRDQGHCIDQTLTHFEEYHLAEIRTGDIVIGTLPIQIVARICAMGGRYLHLALDVPEAERGHEYTTEDMLRFNARLEEYRVEGPVKDQ